MLCEDIEVPLKPGQGLFSIRRLADHMAISRGALRNHIKNLSRPLDLFNGPFMKVEIVAEHSLITIINYDEYQLGEREVLEELQGVSPVFSPVLSPVLSPVSDDVSADNQTGNQENSQSVSPAFSPVPSPVLSPHDKDVISKEVKETKKRFYPTEKTVKEMATLWDEIMPIKKVGKGSHPDKAPELCAKLIKRLKSNPWIYEDFKAFLYGSLDIYGEMIEKGKWKAFRFKWVATGPLDKIRDAINHGKELLEQRNEELFEAAIIRNDLPKELDEAKGIRIWEKIIKTQAEKTGDTAGEIWAVLAEKIKRRYGADDYRTWFSFCSVLAFDGNAIWLAVPNSTYADWLQETYYEGIIEEMKKLGIKKPRMVFTFVYKDFRKNTLAMMRTCTVYGLMEGVLWVRAKHRDVALFLEGNKQIESWANKAGVEKIKWLGLSNV